MSQTKTRPLSLSALYAQRKCPWGYSACILDPSGFGLPLPGLPQTSLLTYWLGFGQVGLVLIAGTHQLASKNQFLPGKRDFRGCGFISARLETSLI